VGDVKTYIFSILSIVFLSGCATSSLKVSDNNELLLSHDNIVTMIGTKVLSRDSEWYERLDIYKSRVQNDKGLLLYEDVIVDIDWEFKDGPVVTIGDIFDSYGSSILYMNSNLVLLQVKVSKTQYVNMLVEKSDNQEISYVYGFGNDEFLKLANTVKSDTKLVLGKLKHEGIVFSNDIEPLSTWSVRMLLLQPLLQPVMRYGR